jgi:hypothetical protein
MRKRRMLAKRGVSPNDLRVLTRSFFELTFKTSNKLSHNVTFSTLLEEEQYAVKISFSSSQMRKFI